MSFEIIPTPFFLRDLKVLIRKYPSLKSDLAKLEEEILQNQKVGKPLGKDCYKIRIAINSKGKGKSGGGRIITCVKILKEQIFLIAIYDKSEMANITDVMLMERLKNL